MHYRSLLLAGWLALFVTGFVGCGPQAADDDTSDDDVSDDDVSDDDVSDDDVSDDDMTDDDDASDDDTSDDDDSAAGDDDSADSAADPFADAVVSFALGDGGGYGETYLPGVVLGPPEGAGGGSGSTDVLSLGLEGEIVLELVDRVLVDGPGADLLVFENPFSTWIETGRVAVSDDLVTWYEFPCDPEDAAGGYPGCAGVQPVYSNSVNGIDATDPELAGGDAFDLAEIGVPSARYVRIRDCGTSPSYGSPAGGFDLDAIAVVNGL